jgi:hypothetical protein
MELAKVDIAASLMSATMERFIAFTCTNDCMVEVVRALRQRHRCGELKAHRVVQGTFNVLVEGPRAAQHTAAIPLWGKKLNKE